MSQNCELAAKHNECDTKKRDWFFIVCFTLVASFYVLHLLDINAVKPLEHLFHSTYDLMNTMWWGIAIGAFFVGILNYVPREIVTGFLGQQNGIKGILRATLAGLLLDLCSHGILMVGVKLYERGARLGQIMAFLIASPWNSLSLTFILIALIGLKWTLAFIFLSAVIAIISGTIFDKLVDRGTLPSNPNITNLPQDFSFKTEFNKLLSKTSKNPVRWLQVFIEGLKESKAIMKWLFFGVLIAASLRSFIDIETFKTYLGPTGLGLATTIFFATVIEVCSEGSSPIAADILTRAKAPGNSFAFLMSGVSTDYTELMV